MTTLTLDNLVLDIPGRGDGRAISLTLEPGQIWGVLGPNGVGKSTLLHTLAALHSPRAGRVLLDGADSRQLGRRHLAQNIGVVFQEHHDGFPATVLESALIGRHPWLSAWQMESPEDIAQAEQALADLDLTELTHRLTSTLSGGERQRVGLATVLTQAPPLWLVDEPTNHLDLHHQVKVMALLQNQARAGRAVMLCLHDLNLASHWCSHLLLLFPGGEACWGPAADMLVPQALEALYRQRLEVATVGDRQVFVPVTDLSSS